MPSKKATSKPAKPYDEFPLYAHSNKQWAKRIRGKIHYFGSWSDPDAALAKYLRERDYWQAGQAPPTPDDACLTMVELVNAFLESKDLLVESNKLSRRMFFDYRRSCERLLLIVRRGTIVNALRPPDFDKIAAKLAEGAGAVTQANRIRLARILFKFAYDQDLIEKPLKFGQNFKGPDRAKIRAERQAKPAKDFKAEEIRAIVEAAKSPLKAMVLLGINCGFGQTDCATLPKTAINLDAGWIDFPRPKTAVERRCPLWPETVEALRIAMANRPSPNDPKFENLAFITKYGSQYVRLGEKGVNFDAVAGEFAKVLSKLKLAGNRRAFYSLRRTFETIGGASRDQISVDHIMGHSPASEDMGAVYRQHIDDERLKAVTDHVRQWLWPSAQRVPRKKAKASNE